MQKPYDVSTSCEEKIGKNVHHKSWYDEQDMMPQPSFHQEGIPFGAYDSDVVTGKPSEYALTDPVHKNACCYYCKNGHCISEQVCHSFADSQMFCQQSGQLLHNVYHNKSVFDRYNQLPCFYKKTVCIFASDGD